MKAPPRRQDAPRTLPLARAATPDGQWCIAVLGRLDLEELRDLAEATRETRSDDEYLAAFKRWLGERM